jgi:type I restriction enzyme S subunit
LATIKTGCKPEEILEEPTEYEYINAGTTNSGYAAICNCKGDTVTTPSRGQGGIGFVGYQHKPFLLGPLCYKIQVKDTNKLLNRYLYYYLRCYNEKILAFKKEGGTPAVNASDLIGISIDVPPIEEQEHIVAILDRFDVLCNDITEGLPAEIEARQKQYEYYRDKLLTFPEYSA